jgi:heme-degrading monooxygenase HmoA
MIGRLWHGWTTNANADEYEKLLVAEVLPGIHRVPGYRGAWLMRRPAADGIEFVTLTLFDSMEAVRAFAGEDYEKAVIFPAGDRLLSRYDERSVHYEVVLSPQARR